jgi:AraC-like DNA-binding protein
MGTIDLKLITLGAASFTALTAMLIITFDLVSGTTLHRKLKSKLLLYFFSHIISECCFFIYFYFTTSFMFVNWLLMLSFTLIPVFLYSFIFNITSINPNEKFPKYHYALPVTLSLIMLYLSVITPINQQLATFRGDGIYKNGPLLFTFFSNKLLIRLLFSTTYVILGFRRLTPYKHYIKGYSSNEEKSSLKWLRTYLFFMVCLIPIPLVGAFISRSNLAKSYFTWIYTGLLIFQHSYLTYNVIKEYYVLPAPWVDDDDDFAELNEADRENKNADTVETKKELSKIEFETILKQCKPFQKPNLKITELAELAGINRTYMSSFINKEYGINFSRFINILRLEEYNELRSDIRNKNKSNTELVEKAGFGSYRSYNRFLKVLDEKE